MGSRHTGRKLAMQLLFQADIQNVDGIYVSHIHPDHYDERYFKFSKDIPLIILNEGPNLDKYYKKETKKVITKILRKNGYKPSKYHASGQVRGFGTMHTSSDFGYYFEREGLISLFGDEKELDKKIKKLKRELEKAGITVRDSGGEFLSYDSLSLKSEE